VKHYLLSLGAGLLVGIIYAVLKVRTPAPPIIALVGLLGILVGEQIPPLARRLLDGGAITVSSLRDHHWNHIFGALPTRTDAAARTQQTNKKDERAP